MSNKQFFPTNWVDILLVIAAVLMVVSVLLGLHLFFSVIVFPPVTNEFTDIQLPTI